MIEKEYHVDQRGNDKNPGTKEEPLKTIQAAAQLAQAGDTVTVHQGIYRERIDPPRGGDSDDRRIVYQSAPGESVSIKGSDVIKEWVQQDGDVWMVSLSNDYFGAFNPYANLLGGDWFFPQGRAHHSGAVYINDQALNEAASLDELFCRPGRKWFAKSGNLGTKIWANFQGADPNKELVEINKRQTVFYPSQPGRNYITVRGFTLSQAATPWSPPTTEQIGLIGVNWSKGWVIENNTITHSRCSGITLGKYFDREDGHIEYGYNAHYQTVKRVLEKGEWTKENIGHHIVRNNHIAYCEQTGIVGSHGAAFSTITGNIIHDIHVRCLFGGFEQAGIKLHAPVDTEISHNLIYNCIMGVWLDWMNQGTRVSGNIMHDNNQWDLFIEISHGPTLVDNNLLMSKVSLHDSAQGGAYVHNLFAGEIRQRGEPERETQYFTPHSTDCLGVARVLDGDDRFYNNIIMNDNGLESYDGNKEELWIDGNVYLYQARVSKQDRNALIDRAADTRFRFINEGQEVFLEINLNAQWGMDKKRQLVTTGLLGKNQVCQQDFETPQGEPLAIDQDYYGSSRQRENPFPGPIEISESVNRIKIWPPNGKVRTIRNAQKVDESYEIEPR